MKIETKEPMILISVLLPKDLRADLLAIALSKRCHFSDVVRTFLKAGVLDFYKEKTKKS